MRLRFFVLVLLLLIALAGCSRDPNEPELIPVVGTVTLDNGPLASAVVTFIPINETPGKGAVGQTDGGGRYQLKSPDGKKGLPAGEYKVIVSKLVLKDGSDYIPEPGVAPIDSPGREKLPATYSEAEHSVLKKTVSPGSGPIDFPLRSDGRAR